MSYTTQVRVEARLGPERVEALTDRDEDGAIDAGVMADAIAAIDSRIDGALAVRYVVPGPDIGNVAPAATTPSQLIDLANTGVAMLLYQWLDPKGDDAEMFRVAFEGDDGEGGMLGRYRKGTEKVIGLDELPGDEGVRSTSFRGTPPTIAGATGRRWGRCSSDNGDGI